MTDTPTRTFRIRDFAPADTRAVNALALAAFEQYRDAYSDWETLKKNLVNTTVLSRDAELIVAESERGVIGSVAYAPPHQPKGPLFDPAWPVMRMLVVSPLARGLGVGRALTEECIARARRDGAPVFALHTSRIMDVALKMYLRMGFEHLRDVPPVLGVPYAVYIKRLSLPTAARPA